MGPHLVNGSLRELQTIYNINITRLNQLKGRKLTMYNHGFFPPPYKSWEWSSPPSDTSYQVEEDAVVDRQTPQFSTQFGG